jgi:poly(A) polymerase
MAASPHVQPISRREDALAIVKRLVSAGHIAYFAGGCVRDALLGLDPKDYDVATSAPPPEVCRLFPRSQGVGEAFGVVLVRIGQSVIEVATFRADGTYSDGRHPDEVHFAGPDEDARRRDFTVNGLFFDPLADRVIDLVGGVEDLQRRVLRAIGDPQQRFAEDYLRLLRAARFAARYGLKIEDATADAIRANADRLPRIAPERIADELRAMLTSPSRNAAVRLLDDLRLTPVLLRHIREGTPALPARPLFEAVCAGDAPSFALALAALTVESLLAAGKPLDDIVAAEPASVLTRELRRTFRLSNEESASIRFIVELKLLLSDPFPRVAALKRFLASADSSEARRLLRGLAAVGRHAARITAIEAAFASFAPDSVAPRPLVTGDDLTTAGYAPGPAFKIALDNAYDAQLEGRARSKAEAMTIALAALG